MNMGDVPEGVWDNEAAETRVGLPGGSI